MVNEFDITAGHYHDGVDSRSLVEGNLPTITTLGTIATGVWEGTVIATEFGGTAADFSATDQGTILYFSAAGVVSALAPGTSGYYLKTLGAAANPAWAISGLTLNWQKQQIFFHASDYYSQDEILCFGMGDAMFVDNKDESYLENAVTWTSLTTADLTDGKVSRQAVDFDGTNDYAAIAHSATQAGMTTLTIEAWLYRDTAGNTDQILKTVTDSYLQLSMDNTVFAGSIATASGTETISATHGLATNGINQWVHMVLVWDSASAADVYVNGVNKNGGNDSGNGAVSDSANGINIGANEDGASNRFHGVIDVVRILNRKMGATEILERYNAFV